MIKKTTKKTAKNIAALEAKYRQADFARLVYLDVMTNLADILHMPEVELKKLIHEACENVKEMKNMRLESQKRASRKYQKNNIIMKNVSFNKRTDTDLVEYIETVDNFSAFVKEILREKIYKNT